MKCEDELPNNIRQISCPLCSEVVGFAVKSKAKNKAAIIRPPREHVVECPYKCGDFKFGIFLVQDEQFWSHYDVMKKFHDSTVTPLNHSSHMIDDTRPTPEVKDDGRD